MAGGTVDCAMVHADLDRYLDGELPPERLALLRAHMAACFPCADRATFAEQLQAVVRDRCAEHAPPALVARIRDHLASVVG